MGAGRCGTIAQPAKWAQEDVETLHSLLNNNNNNNNNNTWILLIL
jgi:hypothetical protein